MELHGIITPSVALMQQINSQRLPGRHSDERQQLAASYINVKRLHFTEDQVFRPRRPKKLKRFI